MDIKVSASYDGVGARMTRRSFQGSLYDCILAKSGDVTDIGVNTLGCREWMFLMHITAMLSPSLVEHVT